MDFTIRPARPDDLGPISTWTQDTFAWGDYVSDRFIQWLDEEDSLVSVCVGDDDMAMAVSHARMLSPTEGWLEGARVHPDFRRSGMGTALNHEGVAWARARGAKVVRLAIETDNEPARRQVEKLGYRMGSEWMAGSIELDGPYRPGGHETLGVAAQADVDGAWMFWSTSEIAGAGRSLLCDGWQFRKATVEDLHTAAQSRLLLQSSRGWVMLRSGSENAETRWMATAPEDLPGLLDQTIDFSAGRAAKLVVKLPALDWVSETMRRSGFSVLGIAVYYLAT